jgi:hypothetical protein
MTVDEHDDPRPPGGLTRVAANLTPRAITALTVITSASGGNRTDAINDSLRAAATLLPLAHADGTLHVLAPDGTLHVVHMP